MHGHAASAVWLHFTSKGGAGVNLQNLRWSVIVVSMVLTVSVLFGAGYLLQSRGVEAPLRNRLAASPVVESLRLEQRAETREVVVLLRETDHLPKAYSELRGEVDRALRGPDYRIRLEDRRTPELEQALRRFDLYLHEAASTGRFAEMAGRVESEAEQAGITARVWVDSQRIYLQLHKDGAYLYSVLERTSPSTERPSGGGVGL